MGRSTGKSKVTLNESFEPKGYYDMETRDFEIFFSSYVMNGLFGEEKLTFYGKAVGTVVGTIDEEGKVYVLGRRKDLYPKKMIEVAERRKKS